MRPTIFSCELTPDRRRQEIATILAAGVLRLRKLRLLGDATTPHGPTNPLELSAQGLEVSGKTVLSVHSG